MAVSPTPSSDPKPEIGTEVNLDLSSLNSPVPSEERIREFLSERFARLSAGEQSAILARMYQLAHPKGGADGVETSLREIFGLHSSQGRAAMFKDFVETNPNTLDSVKLLLLEQHRDYFPAMIVALNAMYSGDEVGLLTSRGNRRGHQALIEAIEEFLGRPIPRHNQYFVNDDSRNERIAGIRGTGSKKLEILVNFATGVYVDREGNQKNLSNIYEVYFYDDSPNYITTAQAQVEERGLGDRIHVIDSTKLSIDNEWNKLMDNLLKGPPPEKSSKPVIHFIDIDECLISVEAFIYVVDKRDGTKLVTITQEEFANQPDEKHWLLVAQTNNPELSATDVAMSYEDFRDPEIITRMVIAGKEGNRMYQRPRKNGPQTELHPGD